MHGYFLVFQLPWVPLVVRTCPSTSWTVELPTQQVWWTVSVFCGSHLPSASLVCVVFFLNKLVFSFFLAVPGHYVQTDTDGPSQTAWWVICFFSSSVRHSQLFATHCFYVQLWGSSPFWYWSYRCKDFEISIFSETLLWSFKLSLTRTRVL